MKGSGSLGRARYLGDAEREKERKSHAVSMDRKSGPPSSQPVGYSSKGSLETVPIDWYRLTRGEREVMRMGEKCSGSRRHLPDCERRRLVRMMADKAASQVCSCGGKAKGPGGHEAPGRWANIPGYMVYMVDALDAGGLGSGSMPGRRRPTPDHGGDRHHVPGETHAAAYRMHAKEA